MSHPTLKKRKIDFATALKKSEIVDRVSAEQTSVQKNAPTSAVNYNTIYADLSGDLSGDLSTYGAAGASNAMDFQLQNLTAKVRHAHGSRTDNVENTLRKLKEMIENIPNQQSIPIITAEEILNRNYGISIPFCDPKPDPGARYKFVYEKPANINVVGSYARKTEIKVEGQIVIDLAVTMPPQIFQEKDYTNYRYFHKRACYLARIAAAIQVGNALGCTVKYGLQNENHLQPILLIDLDSDRDKVSEPHYQIRIILAATENLFPINKILPSSNCIRAKEAEEPNTDYASIATSFYNATLRSECSSLPYLKLLHQSSISLEAFGDACLLGAVWLQKRGLGTSLAKGGFGNFEWACLIALLLQSGGLRGRPVLSRSYNSYQVFKAVLKFLASTDLIAQPLIIHYEDLNLFDRKGPVLFDGTRGMNILFKMTTWSYTLLRHEASTTSRALNETLIENFESSFAVRMDNPFHTFDYLLRLPYKKIWQRAFKKSECMGHVTQFCQEIYDMLRKGLGDRAKLIHLQYSGCPSWSLSSSRPAEGVDPFILIGFLLNAEKVTRSVDRGPPAEEKAAASAFQKFWGEKSELRRFKDGSILESLVWSNTETYHSVLDQIILYIFERHLGKEVAGATVFLGNTCHNLLSHKISNHLNVPKHFQSLTTAYDVFERDLRSLEGLPLQIRQVSATSTELRFASPGPLEIGPNLNNIKPIKVCVQFEGSARWPDNLSAAQGTKIAFLLKIGDLLERSGNSRISTRLGLENDKSRLLNQSFLDVIYSGNGDNTVFRLRIHHERELNMLKDLLKNTSTDSTSRTETATAMATYKRDFIQGPLHTQAVRTLSTRFPLLSPTIRLMKKWRDSHLLSSHISDELTELLTIRTFVHPYPWDVPANLATGFLRTVDFISKWDWQVEPLIVDFTHEMSAQEIDAIRLQFQAWRKIDPAMNRIAMFAASNLDREGISWTEQGPSKVVAARFSRLAIAACKRAQEQGLDFQAETLFITSTADYDFIIHFHPRFSRSASQENQKQKHRFKNLEIHANGTEDEFGFDPVQAFLEEIETMYSGSILFFHNAPETSLVAGIWNPHATRPRDWKVNLTYSAAPVQRAGSGDGGGDAMVSVNKTATLHDITRLGGDMVSKVEINR